MSSPTARIRVATDESAVVPELGEECEALVDPLMVQRPLTIPLRRAVRHHCVPIADCFAAGIGSGLLLAAFGGLGEAVSGGAVSAGGVVVLGLLGGRTQTGSARPTPGELASLLVLAGLLTLLTIVGPTAADLHLRGWHAAALWGTLAAALALGRFFARALSRALIGPERYLVVGTLTETQRLQHRLETASADVMVIGAVSPSQLRGSDEELQEAITTTAADVDADRLIVAASGHPQDDVARLIQLAKLGGLDLSVCSPLLDAATANARLYRVGGVSLLAVDSRGSSTLPGWVTRSVNAIRSFVTLRLSGRR